MAALSLTEEMFAMIQGLSYSDSMRYVSPGSGLPEGSLCLIAWNGRNIMS